jgi:hypothetical protein
MPRGLELLAGLSILAAPAWAGDGNDTCATAQVIAPGTLTSTAFDDCWILYQCATDFDWYRITVPAGHELVVEMRILALTGAAPLPTLELFDGGPGATCPPAPVYGNGWPPATDRVVRAWTNTDTVSHEAFVHVFVWNANDDGYVTMTYGLDTAIVSPACASFPDDAIEPNDHYSSAASIHDVTYAGLFVRYTRPDVFRVLVPGHGSFTATATFQHAQGDVDLYAGQYYPVASTGTGDAETVTWTNPQSNPLMAFVVAHVKLGQYGECNTYQLAFDVSGGSGTEYCPGAPNSLGIGAHLFLNSAPSASAAGWEWWSYGTRAETPVLLYCGAQQISLPFGDGMRCVAGTLFRLRTLPSGSVGHTLIQIGAGSLPSSLQFQAGSTWNFQTMYRDLGGPLGTGFNLSNGVSVTFTP